MRLSLTLGVHLKCLYSLGRTFITKYGKSWLYKETDGVMIKVQEDVNSTQTQCHVKLLH